MSTVLPSTSSMNVRLRAPFVTSEIAVPSLSVQSQAGCRLGTEETTASTRLPDAPPTVTGTGFPVSRLGWFRNHASQPSTLSGAGVTVLPVGSLRSTTACGVKKPSMGGRWSICALSSPSARASGSSVPNEFQLSSTVKETGGLYSSERYLDGLRGCPSDEGSVRAVLAVAAGEPVLLPRITITAATTPTLTSTIAANT